MRDQALTGQLILPQAVSVRSQTISLINLANCSHQRLRTSARPVPGRLTLPKTRRKRNAPPTPICVMPGKQSKKAQTEPRATGGRSLLESGT